MTVRGMARAGMVEDNELAAPLPTTSAAMDPNTHAFVLATALITSITFAISVMNVLAVVLSHVMR